MTTSRFIPDRTILTPGVVPGQGPLVTEEGAGPAQNVWPAGNTTGGGGLALAPDVIGAPDANTVVAWRNQPLDPTTMQTPALQTGFVPQWDGAKWIGTAGAQSVTTMPVSSSSSPGVAGQALLPTGASVVVADAAGAALADPNSPFAGVALAAIHPGSQVPVLTQGPLVGFSLGAGVACAVGADNTGRLIRVTDAANVFGLRYVGTCDTSGAVFVQPEIAQVADVRYYGAKADSDRAGSGTDLGAVLTAMITLGLANIYIPQGAWRIATTVAVTADVNLRGAGAGIFGGPTELWTDVSVTAFYVPYPAAQGSEFGEFSLLAVAKNATKTVGDWNDGARALTIPGVLDFAVGQVIVLRGVGGQTPLPYTFGTVAGVGDVHVTVSQQFGGGIKVGMCITVGAAFPTATQITAIDETVPAAWVLTMAAPSAAMVASVPIDFCFDLIARIQNIAGAAPAVLTLDGASVHCGSGVFPASPVGVPVEHADTGFYLCTSARIAGVNVGGGSVSGVSGFKGPAFTVVGLTTGVPSSNADALTINDAYALHCRNAIYTRGDAANVCRFVSVTAVQVDDWAFVEGAFLGNVFIGSHADGGSGIVSTQALANASVFVGCYTEGGTSNAFGLGALVLGGTMGPDSGGLSFTQGQVNYLQIGNTSTTSALHQTEMLPQSNWAKWYSAAGPTLAFALSQTFGAFARAGWGIYAAQGIFGQMAFNFDDVLFKAGTLVFPRGFLVGDVPNNTFNPSNGFCIRFEARNDYATLIASNPNTGTNDNVWHVSDLARSLVLSGGFESATCIAAGVAGVAKFRPSGSLGGYETLSVAGTGNVSVLETAATFLTECLELTGVLTGARNVQLPNSAVPYKRWIYNNTTGAFALTIQSLAGGNSVPIAQGSAAFVLYNGTEIRRMTADVVP